MNNTDNKETYTYYSCGFIPTISRKYQGWATKRGRLLILRKNDLVKIKVTKAENKNSAKGYEYLASGYVNSPYEVKKELNDLLKNYKVHSTNTYEYRIDNETLLNILSKSSLKFSFPYRGMLDIKAINTK